MVCAKCGCEQGGVAAQFCRQCGTPLAPLYMPPAPPMGFYPGYRTRVQNHLQPLGILWCLFGTYRIIGGVTAAFFVHSWMRSGMFGDTPPFFTHMIGAAVPAIFGMAVLMGVASLITGYGLLTRQPWARTLAIVVGILSLIKLFFGTALGVYTLWALAPAASGMEWQSVLNTHPAQQI